MIPLLAISIVFLVYGLGDIIATKTKAIVSMMLVGFVVFAILFWTGAVPPTIFADSGLQAFSNVTICMFLVHLGTTMKVKEFIKEWKTVVIVTCSTAAMAFGVYFIGQLLMDRYYALVGGPCLAGGMIAYLIMNSVGETLNRADVSAFALLVLSFQGFIGIPIASSLGTKEGRDVLERWKKGEYVPEITAPADADKQGGLAGLRKFLTVPEKYNSPNVIIFKVAIVAFVAFELAQVTPVHMLIWSLIFGVIFHEIGFLDDAALQKANGFAFVVAGALTSVFAGLANTTPGQLLGMAGQVLIVMVIGLLVGGLVAIVLGKVLHFSFRMSICMMVTALFGFPGTYLISQEISKAVGVTEEEIKIVEGYMMPKLVIGGIVSVSVVSGLCAGVMCTWL